MKCRSRSTASSSPAAPSARSFTLSSDAALGAVLGIYFSLGVLEIQVLAFAVGIVHLADQPYTEISGGERQITLVARALAQEPKILVMDEPTASLDFGNQVRVLSQIKALAGRGIAVILSTHDPDQAFLCAHRVAILHNGRLAHLGSPREVITSENLRAIYGVNVEVRSVERDNGESLRVCVPSLAQSNREDVISEKSPA